MLLEHERNYGLGMNALVTVCFWNTNGIMVWAWMLWSPYALGTRTELWFGHECSGHRMLLEHERNYGLGMDALVTVCSWNTNGIMVWAWMLWSPSAFGTRTNYGLGMDALVTVCSWNTNGIMVWAWMLWSPSAFGTRTELWFGHGCSAHRMLLEHERNYGLGMDALVTVCFWNTNELWFGHGCSAHRMLLEHERNYGLGMHALVTVCFWNTNGIMVWAWMRWGLYTAEKLLRGFLRTYVWSLCRSRLRRSRSRQVKWRRLLTQTAPPHDRRNNRLWLERSDTRLRSCCQLHPSAQIQKLVRPRLKKPEQSQFTVPGKAPESALL